MAIISITTDNLAAVTASSTPVLVDFWASWCGPCRQIAPLLDQIAAERPSLLIGKVNVDEQPELAAQFGVSSIPTLLVFRDGQVAARSVGAVPKRQIEALLAQAEI